jgi:hypothetical protein
MWSIYPPESQLSIHCWYSIVILIHVFSVDFVSKLCNFCITSSPFIIFKAFTSISIYISLCSYYPNDTRSLLVLRHIQTWVVIGRLLQLSNRVSAMYTQLWLTTLVLLWGRILDKSKISKSDLAMSPSCFTFVFKIFQVNLR